MKKILQVCNTDFYLTKFLIPLLNELYENGYEVHTACHSSKNFTGLENKPFTHHNVSFPNSPSPIGFYKSIKQLIKIIKNNNFDCVNSHNRNASIATRIAAWWCKVPINLYTAHGFYYHDDQSKITKYLTVQLERILAKMTTHTLSQSQEDVDLMTTKGYIKNKDITWIGNGIDNIKFKRIMNNEIIRDKLKLPKNAFIVTAIGRLVEGKGFQDLIAAFSHLAHQYSDVHLLIIGGNISKDISPFEQEIKALIEKNNLTDKITLTGMINNVEEFLGCSDVYVLPSYREGLSRSMLEAMSCEVPIIVTKIRGCREVIIENNNGCMYEPRNIKQLSDLLQWSYNHPIEIKEYANNAQILIKDIYNEKKYTNRQVTAIKELINNDK